VVRCFDGGGLGLFLSNTLGNKDIVFGFLFFLMFQFTLLESVQMTTTLETEGRNQSLDLRSLGIRFRVFLLATLDLSPNHVFPNIVLLTKVEEFPDLGRTLGTKSLGENSVGKGGDLGITLFDDDEGKHGDVGSNDTATNRFAPTLASAASSVTGVTVGKKESNTVGQENTLLHRKTLLVVTTSDAENVSLPFVSERVSWNFLSDFLVEKYTVSLLVVDV